MGVPLFRFVAAFTAFWSSVLVASPRLSHAQLAVVPTDHVTIQAAVDAVQGMPGATVRIDSNATFVETVTIHESLVLEAGAGFTPTIQGAGAICNVPSASCTLNWNPDAAAATSFVLRRITLLPAVTPGSGSRVVQVLNQGAGESTIVLDRIAVRDPSGSGPAGFSISNVAALAGANLVRIHDSSIRLSGEAGESNFGVLMQGNGSLTVERLTLQMNGAASVGFALFASSNPLAFSLVDSQITIAAPPGSRHSQVAALGGHISATILRNVFRAIGGEGGTAGIVIGGALGPLGPSFLIDENRFLGNGDNLGAAIEVAPFVGDEARVIARNNLVQGMGGGFRLAFREQDRRLPSGAASGTVTAVLVNNTVVGSSSRAGEVDATLPGTLEITLVNNLFTHSAGAGVAVIPGAGTLALSHHHNGYFANSGGDVVGGGFALGPDDVAADPNYSDLAAGDFHLGTSSPMLGRGSNSEPLLPEVDADQEPRIQNGFVDIGAFEGGEVGSVLEVPTLGELGLITLAALTAGAAVHRLLSNRAFPRSGQSRGRRRLFVNPRAKSRGLSSTRRLGSFSIDENGQ